MRLSWYLILAVCISCHPRIPADTCSTPVRILKLKLDGCEYLLITQDSLRLLPLNGADYPLESLAIAHIEYVEVTEAMSTCMAEDKIVEITCFTADSSIPRKAPCLQTTDPNGDHWLANVMQEMNPVRIDRCKYLDGFAYICSTHGEVKIYDCQGTLLCTGEEKCDRYYNALTEKINIWTSHR